MEDLEQEKIKAEIIKLKTETKAAKTQSVIDSIKSISILIGSIILFILIQRPESILNRKSSEETIMRERAKLLLEITKEENPLKMKLGLAIIKGSYPIDKNSKWLIDIEKVINSKAEELIQKSLRKEYDSIENLINNMNAEKKFIEEGKTTMTEISYNLFKLDLERLNKKKEDILKSLK